MDLKPYNSETNYLDKASELGIDTSDFGAGLNPIWMLPDNHPFQHAATFHDLMYELKKINSELLPDKKSKEIDGYFIAAIEAIAKQKSQNTKKRKDYLSLYFSVLQARLRFIRRSGQRVTVRKYIKAHLKSFSELLKQEQLKSYTLQAKLFRVLVRGYGILFWPRDGFVYKIKNIFK